MQLTRDKFIERYLPKGWKPAKTESGAIYKNLRGYNISVMERNEKPGHWKWRMRPVGMKNASKDVWSERDCLTELAAKRAVLEELAKKLGI